MSRVTSSILPLCFAIAAGCSSQPTDLIDYQVTGGLAGNGDGTSLTLDSRGIGTRTTSNGDTVPVHLGAAALDDLNAKIHDAQFATLQPSYGCHGCNDQYVYQIAVLSDGRHYEVSVDKDSSVVYPDGLRALIATLTQLAPR